MNYYKPRELKGPDGKPSGRYHFTTLNDGLVWPVGYCARACAGHETREEAREHYRAYVLDTAQYEQRLHMQQKPCEVCGDWTQGLVQAGSMGYHVLCDDHRNRLGLAQVLEVTDFASTD